MDGFSSKKLKQSVYTRLARGLHGEAAHLGRLDHGQVIDATEAGAHGRAQPGRPEGKPAAQTVPELLVPSIL